MQTVYPSAPSICPTSRSRAGKGAIRPSAKSAAARFLASAIAAVSALMMSGIAEGGTHVWSGASTSKNWSTPTNWASGGVPSANESAPVIIEFPAGFSGGVTNNLAGLKVDALHLLGSGLVIHGANDATLTFKGTAGTNLYSAGGNHIMADLPLVLEGNNRMVAPVLLSLYSQISGNGGLTIDGGVRFDGAVANTYTGPTIVRSGALTLDRQFLIIGGSIGVVSVPGPLVIEGGLVIWSSDDNIADSSLVTIETGGTLNLNGHNDAIGGLDLTAGAVQTGTGTLTLNGNARAEGSSSIAGKLSLGGSTRTFEVDVNDALTISAVISGGTGVGLPGLIKAGAGELVLTAANSFPGNVVVNAGTLDVRHGGALGGAAFGGTVLSADTTLSLAGGVVVLDEPLALNNAKLRATGDAAWSGPITLTGDCLVQCSFGGTDLTLSGAIGGTGGFDHIGLGRLTLGGSAPNTFTGTAVLSSGVLRLAKDGGVPAIESDLIIGGPFHTNNADLVFLSDHHQIADTASVTVLASGLLALNGFNETVGSLVLHGGEVSTGVGTLAVDGSITVQPSTGRSIISGQLALTPGTNVFNVLPSPTSPALEVPAAITGPNTAILRKEGGGEMSLLANNTYFGPTVVAAGWLGIRHPHALGDANPFNLSNGTVVLEGGTLALDGVDAVAEKLTLNGPGANGAGALINQVGNNSWTGPVLVNSDSVVNSSFGGALVLSGVVSGTGSLTKTGVAMLTFAGDEANSLIGVTKVSSGRLILAKPNNTPAILGTLIIGEAGTNASDARVLVVNDRQLAIGCSVTININGTLELGSQTRESINTLTGLGTIDLNDGTLLVGSGSHSGVINGTGGRFEKGANGLLTLSGNNTYTGLTTVKGGTLCVNGNQPLSTIVVTNNATLSGAGAVGAIQGKGGRISPGTTPTPAQRLNSKSVSFTPTSHFVVQLNGPNPNTGYDQLDVQGNVNLAGCQLDVSLGFAGSLNSQFVIIKNDGGDSVIATFEGLPEGQFLHVNSTPFQISYHGGDGNDVVLTQTGSTISPEIDGIAALPNGNPQVNGTGIPFHLYTVERSTDLKTWTPLDSVAADDGGGIHYEDEDGFSLPHAFYRFLAVEDDGGF